MAVVEADWIENALLKLAIQRKKMKQALEENQLLENDLRRFKKTLEEE